ncbi:MAG: recombination mediator RecR [Planctomycetota bacterium]|uniref:recombination mediator RecR n=1 Tax=uncultured Gimesia sp. TaxID=1678688 RepID=UPI0034547511
MRGRESQSHPYGSSVGHLIDQFATLPGIGRKSAERLAHYILAIPERDAQQLANAILAVKQSVRPCSVCFNLTETELCSICSDSRRDKKLVCVVEQPRDVVSLEAASSFQGVYHVLRGRISPLEGIGPDNLTIDALIRRVKQDGVTEIIMATNPTLEGDGTALYISNLLENENVEITRLARGIASGSVLEFANKEMLSDALHGRQRF